MKIRPALMTWNDIKVTDHNRAPVELSIERLEKKTRMANGRLRRYVVAKKRSWQTSWEWLPDSNNNIFGMGTFDNGMAGEDIENFCMTQDGEFTLKLYNGRGACEEFQVMISDFGKEITKRGSSDFWSFNVTLQEV